MTEKLENLFNQTKEYGKYTRINDLDGLEQWNVLKKILLKSDVKGEWNPKVKTFFVDMRSELKIQECENEIPGKNENDKHMLWEKNHFYLQHARIPTLNFSDAKLVRLIQIAYNAGQLETLHNDPFYTVKMKEYYNQNNLGNMETYMTNHDLVKLNDSITDEMTANFKKIFEGCEIKGGTHEYERKYLKYKSKYLSFKSQKNH